MMYEKLRDFNNHGGWILNFGGNSVYREIEFYNDGSHHCVSLLFNRSVNDEVKLLGVRFNGKGYGTCAPFKALKPEHWVFKGMGLRPGEHIGIDSLNGMGGQSTDSASSGSPGVDTGGRLCGQGASGWELDKTGITTPDDFICIAKGLNEPDGAHMVCRDPKEGRGGVFSVSSITFTGALLTDEHISRLARNVVRQAVTNGFPGAA